MNDYCEVTRLILIAVRQKLKEIIMRLSLFKVQNFRSFHDSGWVSCQDVTALAGVNEAGKSNLLKALWKLKPAFKVDNKITISDLPRDKSEQIMESGELPVFVTAKFKLDTNDLALLRKTFPTLKPFDTCLISRSLNGKYTVEVPVSVPAEIEEALHNLIIRIMPGFIYFSNYGNLDSNIYLPQMLSKFNKQGVNENSNAKRRTVKLLLMYMGITPEMLAQDMELLSQGENKESLSKFSAEDLSLLAQKQEKYQQILKDAGERLSNDFNNWWRQGKYTFEFTLENNNLKIWVTDDQNNRAPLEERSVGMQWFLSFFLVFTLESQLFYTNTVLLLDESGMTLHGLAQKDLVRLFENLSKTNQLVYTTHSSFMLPTEQLNRIKVVYKDKDGHSIVSNDLNVNNEHTNELSLYPVESSVGIDVSSNILNNSQTVVVIGKADQTYLNIIKNYVFNSGKFKSYQDIVFVVATANGIDGLAQILSKGQGLPKVVLPNTEGGQHMKEYLLKHSYKNDDGNIIMLNEFGVFDTIEDVFPYQVFATGAGNYLAQFFGKDFELDLGLGFLSQLYTYAEQHQIVLPDNFRDEIAQRVGAYIKKRYNEFKIPRAKRKLWTNIISIIS